MSTDPSRGVRRGTAHQTGSSDLEFPAKTLNSYFEVVQE